MHPPGLEPGIFHLELQSAVRALISLWEQVYRDFKVLMAQAYSEGQTLFFWFRTFKTCEEAKRHT